MVSRAKPRVGAAGMGGRLAAVVLPCRVRTVHGPAAEVGWEPDMAV